MKMDGLSFLFVTLSEAILEQLYFSNCLKACGDLLCTKLSITSVLEQLNLKDLHQRSSQRVKWTSGGRDTIIFNRMSVTNYF